MSLLLEYHGLKWASSSLRSDSASAQEEMYWISYKKSRRDLSNRKALSRSKLIVNACQVSRQNLPNSSGVAGSVGALPTLLKVALKIVFAISLFSHGLAVLMAVASLTEATTINNAKPSHNPSTSPNPILIPVTIATTIPVPIEFPIPITAPAPTTAPVPIEAPAPAGKQWLKPAAAHAARPHEPNSGCRESNL